MECLAHSHRISQHGHAACSLRHLHGQSQPALLRFVQILQPSLGKTQPGSRQW